MPSIAFTWTTYPDTVQDPELGRFIRAINGSLRGLVSDTQSQMLYKTSLPGTWSAMSGFSAGNRRFLLQDGTATDSPVWGQVTAGDIASGILGVKFGGTGSDLSSYVWDTALWDASDWVTGGTSQVVMQETAGGNFTVKQLNFTDLLGTVANSQLLASYAAITSLANLVTVGALTSGSIGSGFGSINIGTNSFTGGAATLSAASCNINITSSTGTNATFVQFNNTGGTYYVGPDSSGGALSGNAYDMTLIAPASRGVSILAGGAVQLRIASTGAASFGSNSITSGAITATGQSALKSLGAFATNDKYVVIDTNGNLHVSSLGPAS